MKFATQHKNFMYSHNGGKKQSYRAHRDGSSVWVTGGEKGLIISSHEYDFVSQAKAWMNSPKMSY